VLEGGVGGQDRVVWFHHCRADLRERVGGAIQHQGSGLIVWLNFQNIGLAQCQNVVDLSEGPA
jgi:hypothetical protein